MPNIRRSLAGIYLRLLAMLLAAPAVAQLNLEPCELTGSQGVGRVSARCGTLQVAENPDDPAGRQIDLFVARIPALTTEPAPDALTLINGGPGASSVDLYVDMPQAFAGVRRERDIVLVDQRGTGRSNALACPVLETAMETYSEERVREATRRCLAGLTADTRYYTTSIAVQDLERVRQALGYAQWDLYGVSYGTRVAQHYVRRHPDSIRTLTIDGVVPPRLALGPDIALNAQRTLDTLLSRCEQDDACRGAFPQMTDQLTRLAERLQATPVALEPAHPVTGQREAFQLTYPHLASTLRLLSYAPETASLIPLIVSEATERNNYVPLASQAMRIETEVTGAISFGMHNSVVCTEDVPFFEAGNIAWAQLDATYLGRNQVQSLQSICQIWPSGVMDDDLKAPLETDIPVLLLSGEFDPITPPAYASEAAAGFTQSLHLVAPGQGHGVIGRGCIPTLLSDFVRDGNLDGLDRSCVARLQAAPFFVTLLGPTP